jgi:glycosyltransferase involved in cell wall biosynthesis
MEGKVMPRRRGVLQLRSSLGFFGAENVVLEIAKGLRQTDYRPYIGVFSNGATAQEQLAERARQHEIESVVFQCRPRWDKKAVANIQNFILSNGIEIVQSHGYKADFFALAASRQLRVKKIATCHPWTETSYSSLARFYTWIDKTLLSRFDRIVAVSEPLKMEVLQRRISPERISVIENGIDLRRFQVNTPRAELCREFGLPAEQAIIGTIGRLVPEKGQHLLIEAAERLKDEFADAHFVIVGDGDLRGDLEQQVAAANLTGRFRFLGTSNRVPEILSVMDVFTLPSISEGLPMVILEAMAAKKPIIATKVGAIPEVLMHGEAGIVIPPESEALANAISGLLRNPGEAQKMTASAYQRVLDGYSSEKMVREYVKIYDSLLS